LAFILAPTKTLLTVACAAVNWLKHRRRQWRMKVVLELEGTRSIAKRSKRAMRLCF